VCRQRGGGALQWSSCRDADINVTSRVRWNLSFLKRKRRKKVCFSKFGFVFFLLLNITACQMEHSLVPGTGSLYVGGIFLRIW